MSGFTFDEQSHTYRLDGVRLPSVTEILAPIKPDFAMVPPGVLEDKRMFGTAVHAACEYDDLGELDDDGTDPRVLACVRAWRAFRADTGAAIVENERRLYHPTLRYAGTLDRLAYLRLKDKPEASTWLIDLKTGVDPHPSYGVQLAGYAMLSDANLDESRRRSITTAAWIGRATVHLFDDGTYRFHQYRDPSDEATFMACLAIYRHKEKHA